MAICGGTGIATENKKSDFFLTFFLLVAMCGDMWRYRYRHRKQKSDFFKLFSFWWRCVAICGGTGIATENKKVAFFNFFPFGGDVWRYVAVPVSPRKTKK